MQTETFESKLKTSKDILNQLMNPEITLEESLKLYQEGLKQIQEAQKMIEEAKVKIQVIENRQLNQ